MKTDEDGNGQGCLEIRLQATVKYAYIAFVLFAALWHLHFALGLGVDIFGRWHGQNADAPLIPLLGLIATSIIWLLWPGVLLWVLHSGFRVFRVDAEGITATWSKSGQTVSHSWEDYRGFRRDGLFFARGLLLLWFAFGYGVSRSQMKQILAFTEHKDALEGLRGWYNWFSGRFVKVQQT